MANHFFHFFAIFAENFLNFFRFLDFSRLFKLPFICVFLATSLGLQRFELDQSGWVELSG